MTEPYESDEAFCERLLAPPQLFVNPPLQEELLRRTTRTVRRRMIVRRLMTCAAGVALFAAGMGTMKLLTPEPTERQVVIVQNAPIPANGEREAPREFIAQEPNPQRIDLAGLSPLELERRAERTFVPHEAARTFKLAGDRYIAELGDYQAALRCYRNFLDEATPADRQIAPADSWLLITLKRDSQSPKEVY